MVLVAFHVLVKPKRCALCVGTRNKRLRRLHHTLIQGEAYNLKARWAQNLLELVDGLNLFAVLAAALKFEQVHVRPTVWYMKIFDSGDCPVNEAVVAHNVHAGKALGGHAQFLPTLCLFRLLSRSQVSHTFVAHATCQV